MRARKSWFTFARVMDARHHQLYNEYHQLDHRPENLALPGVLFGDRWVRTPACVRVAGETQPPFADVQYLAHYLFEEPLDRAMRSWLDLSWSTFQEGRRPETGLTERPFRGWFIPLKAYVTPRIRISADALPFRPVRGVYVAMSEIVSSAAPAEVQRVLAWEDQVWIPSLLECHGSAGVMVHVSDPSGPQPFSTAAGTEGFNTTPDLRVHVVYLDEDPLEFVEDMQSRGCMWWSTARPAPVTGGALRSLFASPFYAIEPWNWRWFEDE